MMLKQSIIFILLIFLLSACGGSAFKVDEFNLSVNLPSGWKGGKDTYGGKLTVEISNGGRRAMKITEAETTVDDLDMLAKATEATYELLDKESFEQGFGVTMKANSKKQFMYYVKKDGKQYKFEPGPYYEEGDLEACIQIAKSAK